MLTCQIQCTNTVKAHLTVVKSPFDWIVLFWKDTFPSKLNKWRSAGSPLLALLEIMYLFSVCDENCRHWVHTNINYTQPTWKWKIWKRLTALKWRMSTWGKTFNCNIQLSILIWQKLYLTLCKKNRKPIVNFILIQSRDCSLLKPEKKSGSEIPHGRMWLKKKEG